MPVKGFKSLTCKTEAIEAFQRIAANLEMTAQELMNRLVKNEALIPLFLQKFKNAKISGPFARKNGDKLERYFLVDDEAAVVGTWTVENADAIQIEGP